MAVFRVERNKGYTVMSNHHLRNKELSLKAKGLLSQMLSLPEDWDYTLAGLSHINRESIDAIRTAVWELEKAGYITRRQGRDGKGKMTAIEYTIYELPQTSPVLENPTLENLTPDKPILENPIPGYPTTENPMQVLMKSLILCWKRYVAQERLSVLLEGGYPADLLKPIFQNTNTVSRVGWRFCEAKYNPTLTRILPYNGDWQRAYIDICLDYHNRI
jgi:hypothetical protein